MGPDLLFWSVFGFSWVLFVWHFFLRWRQYGTYVRTTKRPTEVESIMDAKSFNKSRAYKIESTQFSLVHMVYSQLENSVVLLVGILPWLWNFSGGCINRFGFEHEILQSAMFISILSVVSTIIGMPWELYDHFVVEERHGFNKLTLDFYLKDTLKKMVLMLVLGLPIMSLVIWIVKSCGDYFFIYLWLFLTVVVFVMLMIYPEFIAPLFDKYEPLPEGDLRTKIEQLAEKVSFPLTKLYVVEGSKRSAHSNAYMYGFWNAKRIVLFDTLLQDYSPVQRHGDEADEKKDEEKSENASDADEHTEKGDADAEAKPVKHGLSTPELLAVLGHELGHWALSHTLQLLVISEVNLFFVLYVVHLLWTWPALYPAFGFVGAQQPTMIGLVLIMQFVLAPFNEVVSFMTTQLVRHNEFAADQYSCELGYADQLKSGLIKLFKDNLSFPVDDWLYSTVTYSHPPLVERIGALKKRD